ncbi:MAG: hypothetical protein K5931_04750 [Lachnospiraceae bacterium]|nr:hypothetical protein [Lachnospiraceae bacterium]
MNSLYPIITGKYKEGVTDLDRLIAPALISIFRSKTKSYLGSSKPLNLTKEEKKRIKEYYKRYMPFDLLYHRAYKTITGRVREEYIPSDIFLKRIEPFYTDRLCSKYLDNKCLYYYLFSNVKKPGLIAMRMGDNWIGSELELISFDKVVEYVKKEEKCVIKKAIDSEGGFGVEFLQGEDKVKKLNSFLRRNKKDIVIQRAIKQHSFYSKLNESSVNSFRIRSLMTKDGVKILCSVLKIGRKGSRVDNLSGGGVFCGIGEDGTSTGIAFMENGSVIEKHPDFGYSLKDIKAPCYEKAEELVRKAHTIMGHCKLASWDVAIDEDGEAILIESNLSLGVLFSIQVCCGPLFGEDTDKILNEVFYDQKGRRRKLPYFGLNPRDYYFLRDNVLGILAGKYQPGYTHSYLLTNPALRVIQRKLEKKEASVYRKLSREEIRQIREYYRPYVKKVNTRTHRISKGQSGSFYPEYIPEDLYMCDIDRYFCDRDLAYYLDNKCYYSRLFPFAKQPETLAMRIGGIWLDKDYRIIDKNKIRDTIIAQKEVVIKAARFSEAGAGVSFVNFSEVESSREKVEILNKCLKTMKDDIVIQKIVKQHALLSALHPSSLNSIRIVSLLRKEGVVILSRSIRIGVGESRVDNICSGGMVCGIDEEGYLRGKGVFEDGRIVCRHPDSGLKLKSVKIPSLDKCDKMIKEAHTALGHNRLISWDVTVDEAGEAVLIECNMSLGIVMVQSVNGPFFGKYTEKVLSEVYGSK